MPDYNPDRERHRDHAWVVHNVKRTRTPEPVVAADKVMKFNKEGRFVVRDEKVAAEIREEYPKDVTVSRINMSHPSDRGHTYFFTVPRLPWKEKEMIDPKEKEKKEKKEELPNTSPPDWDFDSADLDSPQG